MSLIQGPFGLVGGGRSVRSRDGRFDDGSHDRVWKVTVSEYTIYRFITYIKFHYIDGENGVEGKGHGLEPTEQEQRRIVSEFELDFAKQEHITFVEGTFDNEEGYVRSLKFITSTGRESRVFGVELPCTEKVQVRVLNTLQHPGSNIGATGFVLGSRGFKIGGFHGRKSDSRIKAIGVHLQALLVPPARKIEIDYAMGFQDIWDDGVHKLLIYVRGCYNQSGVWGLQFGYLNHGEVIFGDEHGRFPKITPVTTKEFAFEDGDYLVSVNGCYKPDLAELTLEPNSPPVTLSPSLKMIRFTTNRGTSFELGAIEEGTIPFELSLQNHRIVGMYSLDEKFGVYLKPNPEDEDADDFIQKRSR